jgi:hypothetical protein
MRIDEGRRERGPSREVMKGRRAEHSGETDKLDKRDNHPAALKAKVDLRLRVAAEIEKPRVLDLFCGRGEMYRAAWRDVAIEYVGCDSRPWLPTDPPRFVADNRRLLRSLDIGRFNIFDLDAYGAPWEQLELLAHWRQWNVGERGGLVVTDGGIAYGRFGGMPKALARLVGSEKSGRKTTVASLEGARNNHDLGIQAWAKKSRVEIIKKWTASIPSTGRYGTANCSYEGFVFEGR